ncbi:PilZ domain-containing protein [Lentibacillus saliphilus]|uniref:PilZ domain-containing protein n=1 Tax=Lentibacillus saliphilus TaxID=2737028 RepID=UPI001C2F7CA9|nr:PilZ domain-containing protein [Lentibacillus saliphilus]
MRYKRHEGFRLEFGQPLDVQFRIDHVNDKKVASSLGDAKMLDISLQGMKLATALDMVTTQNDITIVVDFKIHENRYELPGQIVWKKKQYDTYHYGIQFELEDKTEHTLLRDLKDFAKRRIEST